MSPIACDPGRTFKLVLESDQDKLTDRQPCFEFRYLAVREWQKISEVCEKLEDHANQGVNHLLGTMIDALRLGLVNWQHMQIRDDSGQFAPLPYDSERLADIITPAEISELLFGILNRVRLDADVKKNYASQSDTAVGKSVPAAPPADAGTAPASGNLI